MRYAVGGSPALNELGGELLVCDAAGQTVHRLTGEGRVRFEQVLEGDLVELADDQVTAALEAAGLIVAVGAPTEQVVGLSRRRVLAVGAAAAAAGVVTMALPRAAAAESGAPNPGGGSYPSAPGSAGSGSAAGAEDPITGVQSTGPGGNRIRSVKAEWYNGLNSVTFSWRLYSPTGVLVSQGTSTGDTGFITVPGGTSGQLAYFYLTAFGGTQRTPSVGLAP